METLLENVHINFDTPHSPPKQRQALEFSAGNDKMKVFPTVS
jgi:hypothetical protein